MINKKEFTAITAALKKHEAERENAIRLSRDVIKLSKEIIYAVHRGDMKTAQGGLNNIQKAVKKLPKEAITGIVRAAKEEYVEAACFFHVVKDHTLPTRADLQIETYEYLAGLCDLTGELVRKAVKSILDGKPEETKWIKDFVEAIYGEFLEMELLDWELRKKYDSIKYNLKKLEDILYDLQIRRK